MADRVTIEFDERVDAILRGETPPAPPFCSSNGMWFGPRLPAGQQVVDRYSTRRSGRSLVALLEAAVDWISSGPVALVPLVTPVTAGPSSSKRTSEETSAEAATLSPSPSVAVTVASTVPFFEIDAFVVAVREDRVFERDELRDRTEPR